MKAALFELLSGSPSKSESRPERPRLRVLPASWSILVALLLTATGSNAQSPDSNARRGRIFVGGSFGMSTGSVDVYFPTEYRATGETQLSVSAGLRLRGSFYGEAVLGGRVDLSRGPSVIGHLAAYPQGYQWTERSGRVDRVDYPLWTTTVRILFEPSVIRSTVRPRLFAGGGMVWGVNLPELSVGAGVIAGGSLSRISLEVASQFIGPYTQVRRTYAGDGSSTPVLLREDTRNVLEHGVLFRLGFQRFLGGRQ